ncbi:ATPase AAA [Clostridia bacterium]|nr:ATPase AAA [Clostridia bacterium]
MLDNATISKLRQMKLGVMASAFQGQFQGASAGELSFDERFGLLVDAEWDARRVNSLKRMIRKASYFCQDAALENIDYSQDRHLDKTLITRLGSCGYITDHHNIIIAGATGSGKTYLACAFGMTANRNFIPSRYIRLPDLLGELAIARSEGTYRKLVRYYQRVPLLILDEWLLYPLKESEVVEVMELIEKRQKRTSTIFCSQFDVPDWHQRLCESTLADAICDRIVHDAYRIEIHGDDSMRRLYGVKEQV